MNILHISPYYYPATYWGGPVFSVHALNSVIAKQADVSLHVLTTDSAGPHVSDRTESSSVGDLGYRVTYCRRVIGLYTSIELLKRLPHEMRKSDIIHLTSTHTFATIPALILARKYNMPVVWSPRGAILEACVWKGARKRKLKQLWEWFCNQLIAPGTVALHVTTETEKRISSKRISRAEPAIIPNGVDSLPDFPIREWMPDGVLRVMFLGRLSPVKGLENLIDAIALLNKALSVRLSIYGSGDEDYGSSLMKRASSLNLLDDSIFFCGHIRGEEKKHAFLHADVCIIPSHSENFSMVAAEALGHGTPVITSIHTPWQEVEEKDCGLWVDNSPESLARAIGSMASRDLENMGENGWQWMQESFSWDTIGKNMLRLYSKMLKAD